VWAVHPRNRNLAPKVRVFVDFLVERFAAEPPWERRASGSGPPPGPVAELAS